MRIRRANSIIEKEFQLYVYSLFSFNSTLDFEWLLYVSAVLPITIKEKKQFSPDKHRPMTLTTFLLAHIHSLN